MGGCLTDNSGTNKRSEFGLGFYNGTDRANDGTTVQDRPTQPFVDALCPVSDNT